MMVKTRQEKIYKSTKGIVTVSITNGHSNKLKNSFLTEVVEEFFLNADVNSFRKKIYRETIVEIFNMFFEDYMVNGTILNYRTIFDFRNNTHFLNSNTFNIDVYFLQKNCLTTTHINLNIVFFKIESSPKNFQLILT